MKTSDIASNLSRLSLVIDLLARRAASVSAREAAASEEQWLGWDAWVPSVRDVRIPGGR